MKRFSRAFMAPLVTSLLIQSCVTTPKKRRADGLGGRTPSSEVPQSKIGTKTPSSSEMPQVVATNDDMLQFLMRAPGEGATLSDADRQLIATIPTRPKRGSLAEAAQVVASAKIALSPMGLGRAGSFVESDLEASTPRNDNNSRKLSLATIAEERGVNLPLALATNSLLQNVQIAKLIVAALNTTADSTSFVTEVKGAVASQASLWQEVVQNGNTLPTDDVAAVPPTATEDFSALPPNPGDLRSGDALLVEAQNLADRGQFESAIGKANRIPPDSPLHAAAQDKVRTFSNRAVQDLRRKAMQAFQSAAPIGDQTVRATYLNRAKVYLEEALTKYPSSDQLGTVRDNLATITRDLDRLTQEKPGDGDDAAAVE